MTDSEDSIRRFQELMQYSMLLERAIVVFDRALREVNKELQEQLFYVAALLHREAIGEK